MVFHAKHDANWEASPTKCGDRRAGSARSCSGNSSGIDRGAAEAAEERVQRRTGGGDRIMKLYLCPKCGTPGVELGSINGFTRLACQACRLAFEQPTNHPAHEGYQRFGNGERTGERPLARAAVAGDVADPASLHRRSSRHSISTRIAPPRAPRVWSGWGGR